MTDVSGGSSGIGLATTNLLLDLGAKVVIGDLQPPTTPIENDRVSFHKTDVTAWSEQLSLFKKTRELHGRVDHVFANAGVGPRADYLSTALDQNGDLVEPTFVTLDVNLKAVIYTATIAVYYMREEQQSPAGGSIVIVSSVAGVSRFRAIDYGKDLFEKYIARSLMMCSDCKARQPWVCARSAPASYRGELSHSHQPYRSILDQDGFHAAGHYG